MYDDINRPTPEELEEMERDLWRQNGGNAALGHDRSREAMYGLVGLLSDEREADLENDVQEFFDTVKAIAMAEAWSDTMGEEFDNKTAGQQSLDAIKQLRKAIYDAGMENSTTPEQESRTTMFLLDQEIGRMDPADAFDFVKGIALVTQESGWQYDIQSELEAMHPSDRMQALMYRSTQPNQADYDHAFERIPDM